MGANEPQVWSLVSANFNLWAQGHGWLDGVSHYALLHTKYRSCRFMVSKDFLKSYSPLYSKSMEAKDQFGQFRTQGHGWHDICGEPPNIAIYLYISCGPYNYGIEVFPIISLCELLIPICMTSFHPRGFNCRIYVGDH